MEEAVGRYLGVFLPFIATLVCVHYIVRQSGSEILARTENLTEEQLWTLSGYRLERG